jgi:metallo-beta-lactamase class B
MRRKVLSLLVMLLCLSWGFSMMAMAQSPVQDPDKLWLRKGPYVLLDTPEIMEEMDYARALAGKDYYFCTTQRLQCRDIDDTYTIVDTPGANAIPDPRSTGFEEKAAVPTQVFDNVYYVGGIEVGGWLIDTGDGYIMLDSSYDYGATTILEPNMAALGLDPAKIKYILLTHAGPDHLGAVMHFVNNYGTKLVFNRILRPQSQPPWWKVPDEDDQITLGDGDTLALGDTTITAVHTPRSYNSDGSIGDGLSYFIPVKINRKPHLWATYGNTGMVGNVNDKELYLWAMEKWLGYVDELKPDIAISSHPFVDASLDRMALIRGCRNKSGRNDLCGPHNPFLIGKTAARRYFEIMYQCAVVQTMRQKVGLSSSGLEKLP